MSDGSNTQIEFEKEVKSNLLIPYIFYYFDIILCSFLIFLIFD